MQPAQCPQAALVSAQHDLQPATLGVPTHHLANRPNPRPAHQTNRTADTKRGSVTVRHVGRKRSTHARRTIPKIHSAAAMRRSGGNDLPTRCTIQLEPVKLHDGTAPVETGPAVHAAMLSLLRDVAPELAAALHEGRPPKPFALTPLQSNGQTHTIEVGLLDDRLVPAFRSSLVDGTPVQLARSNFRIVGSAWTTTSYAQILADAPAARSWTLDIHTPATFHGPGSNGVRRAWPFPLPNLAFGSLAHRWTSFAGKATLPPETEPVILDHLVISMYELKTRTQVTKARGNTLSGCVGNIRYAVADGDNAPADGLRGVSALVAFANFSGLGDQTTKGMGWVTGRTKGTSAKR